MISANKIIAIISVVSSVVVASAATTVDKKTLLESRQQRRQMRKNKVIHSNNKHVDGKFVMNAEDVAFWTRSLQSSFPPSPVPPGPV